MSGHVLADADPAVVSAVEPKIRVRDLVKTYDSASGEIRAVDGVSFDVAEGEFVSLLGPSGCGKSTILMLVAGLLSRSSGTIRLDGVAGEGPNTSVGIVFQDAVLLDWRTVLDNVMLQVEVRGLPRDVYRGQAMALLRSVGLEGFEKKRPYELSGGMKQRVSICRALIHDPPVLLMDEPFGALDALTREQMHADLHRLWLDRKKTILFITHSISEAVLLSDRVLVMTPRPGRIAREWRIDLPQPRTIEVQDNPAFGQYVREIRQTFHAMGVLRDSIPSSATSIR